MRVLLCTITLAAGGWLSLRGVHTLIASDLPPVGWSPASPFRPWLGVTGVLAGVGMLSAAVGMAAARVWGWAVAASTAPLGVLLALALAWAGAGADWTALSLCAGALLALASPAARTIFLDPEP